MRDSDTIAAVATGAHEPGRSAHAIVRLSGRAAFDAANALATAPLSTGRGCQRTRLRLQGSRGPVSVPAIAMRFESPASYTGEDCLDLIVPSHQGLTDRLMEALCAHAGVRRAEPGEFTARAYLAGRLALHQAEAVAATIAAQNRSQWRAAQELASGDAHSRHQRWADAIAQTLALVEAGIDFTDQEDVVAITAADLRAGLSELISEMRHSAPALAHRGAVRAALVGPPNAGKSTLFNALLERDRAITSDAAGTTRDAIAEPLDLRPLTHTPIELIDLPGLDAGAGAEDAVHTQAQRGAAEAIDRADVLLVCHPESPASDDARALLVRTMADRPSLGAGGALAVCAIDGFGLSTLRTQLARRCESVAMPARSGVSLLVPRQAAAVRTASEHLEQAALLSDGDERALREPELIAGELRSALDAMGEVTGRVHPDDVIGLVFGQFCVGK